VIRWLLPSRADPFARSITAARFPPEKTYDALHPRRVRLQVERAGIDAKVTISALALCMELVVYSCR
jgi:hypothetical protein